MRFFMILLLFPSLVLANSGEILSEHNEQHVAEDAARELLRKGGCKWTKTKRLERFRVVQFKDNMLIFGYQLLVECVEKESSKGTAVISWDTPKLKENGLPLVLADIKEYEIYANNRMVAKAGGAETQTEIVLEKGQYVFYLVTIDKQGQRSGESNKSTLTIK